MMDDFQKRVVVGYLQDREKQLNDRLEQDKIKPAPRRTSFDMTWDAGALQELRATIAILKKYKVISQNEGEE